MRLGSVFAQMMEIGIQAIPIIALLGGTIGVMLAIQGIHTLRLFGAESRVVIGIALSVTREFAPLITAILVAGRSGSALAARLGTMKISQEIDALHVMGIHPVRYLGGSGPARHAGDGAGPDAVQRFRGALRGGTIRGGGPGHFHGAFVDQTIDVLSTDDLLHGLGKSAIFAVLIAVIGVVNGASVKGGAEGVGRGHDAGRGAIHRGHHRH